MRNDSRARVARIALAASAAALLGGACDVRANASRSESTRVASAERDALADLARSEGLSLVRSEHFEVATDRAPADAHAACDAAERASRALDDLLDRPAPPGLATIVWIEDESLESRAIARCGHRMDAESLEGASGFFSRSCGMIHLGRVPGDGAFERAASALAHEVAHQRLWRENVAVVRARGAWIDEGLATWLESTCDTRASGGLCAERLEQARALSAADMLLPLERFLELDRDALVALRPAQVVYASGAAMLTRWVSLHHVQSCAVMAWLHATLEERFGAFVRRAIERGGTPAELERAIGANFSTLEARFEEWIEVDGTRKGMARR